MDQGKKAEGSKIIKNHSENNNTTNESGNIENGFIQELMGTIPKNTPEPIRERFQQIFAMSSHSIQQKSPMDEVLKTLAKQITPDHLSGLIEVAKEEQKSTVKKDIISKVFQIIVILIVVGLIVFLIISFKSDTEFLFKLLTYLIPMILSFAGGYGFGKTKKSKDDGSE